MAKYKSLPILRGKDDNAFMYGDLHVAGDVYVGSSAGSASGNKLVPPDPADPKIPVVNIDLGIINGIMAALVTAAGSIDDDLCVVTIDTTSDNTLHTKLDQAKNKYGNYKTIVTVGTTGRTMHVDYVNKNNKGGIYTSDGFYVDEAHSVFWTYKMVIQWNSISAFVAKYSVDVPV